MVYLMIAEAPADGAGLLGAEVEGEIFLVLVRLPQRRLLLLRDHGERARDGGAHHLAARTDKAVSDREQGQIEYKKQEEDMGWRATRKLHLGELVGGAASDLGDTEERQFGLELLELRLQLRPALPPQLVHLNPGCYRNTKTSDPEAFTSSQHRGGNCPEAYPCRSSS
jgi:hypothetical protein